MPEPWQFFCTNCGAESVLRTIVEATEDVLAHAIYECPQCGRIERKPVQDKEPPTDKSSN